jgi:hypothetical protein
MECEVLEEDFAAKRNSFLCSIRNIVSFGLNLTDVLQAQ